MLAILRQTKVTDSCAVVWGGRTVRGEMALRTSGYTRASALGPIAQFVDRQGGSIVRIFDAADLPISILEQPDIVLPLREQFRLLKRAARTLGDDIFGARLGELVKAQSLSAFGAWVCRAATLLEAMERSEAGIGPMLQTSTPLTLRIDNGRATWSIDFIDAESEGREHNEFLALGYMLDLVRTYVSRSWRPCAIGVTITCPARLRALEDLHGAPVVGRLPVTSFTFDAALLLTRRASQSLAPHGHPDVEPMPCRNEPAELARVIVELAALEGYPRLDWVAQKAGLSPRTLQRVLADREMSFQTLVQATLEPRARLMLTRSNQSITQIAHALGYRDAAHFTRAFKRWTGMTPSLARRNDL